MNGLLYKEFRQNRFMLLIGCGIALVLLIMPIKAVIDEPESTILLYKAAFTAAVFFLTGAIQQIFFQSDEQKKWAYFVSATPKSVSGMLWTKYTVVFMTSGICFIYCFIADCALCIFAEDSMVAQIAVQLIYIQLFLRAIEIPFWVRFGTKRGNMVKAFFVLVIIFAVILYLLFGDLSIFRAGLMDRLYRMLTDFMEGNVPDWVFLVQGIFPFAAAALYYLSYKISCRLYLKGVEEFDK
ncbi:MAG: ABC-2 transporter permease [Oscillospiraceae bacterium]|nr:ABC-2 transporter permease [Oscillospiraceae bacterium]